MLSRRRSSCPTYSCSYLDYVHVRGVILRTIVRAYFTTLGKCTRAVPYCTYTTSTRTSLEKVMMFPVACEPQTSWAPHRATDRRTDRPSTIVLYGVPYRYRYRTSNTGGHATGTVQVPYVPHRYRTVPDPKHVACCARIIAPSHRAKD